MSQTLETARLVLLPLSAAHDVALFRIIRDEETLRFWHHKTHRDVSETVQMIRYLTGERDSHWWVIAKRDTSDIIGLVGVFRPAVPAMGYIIHADHWRQGYGTEAVSAVLDYVFTVLALNRIELWIVAENLASQRLAHKVGFTGRGQFYQRYSHRKTPHETLVLGLRADEWTAQRQKQAQTIQRDVPFLSVHAVLPVRDVQTSAAFYRDQLGFTISHMSGYPPNIAIVSRGEWSSEQANLQLRQTDEISATSVFIMVGLSIDQLYAEYRQNKVTISSEIATQPWGIREFTLQDNSGHSLRFGANA